MNRRAAVLVFLSVFGLFALGAGLSVRLLDEGLRTARGATDDRLRAIGAALARALASGAGPELLRGVRRDCLLEDAYLLGADLRPVSGRGTLTLLRVDPDRALRAAAGTPSVGWAYELDAPPPPRPAPAGARAAPDPSTPPDPVTDLGGEQDEARPRGKVVLAGYFPVDRPGHGRQVLVLEAGASFAAAPQALRRTAFGIIAAAAVLGLLCLGLLAVTLRAAARERLLFAQAERGRALSQMAAMVTHEIRNPLGTIRAGVELLRELRRPLRRGADRDGPPEGERSGAEDGEQEIFSDVLEEVSRLKDLSSQFLELARDPPLQPAPCDLGELCDVLCAQLRREHPEEHLLAIERLGALRAPLVADADQLRQVLRNLMLNAVQAMQGRGRLMVRVTVHHGAVDVLVSDDGPGIDGQLSRRLFEPFATTKEGGTGLGLVISRRIAEKHGGALDLLPGVRGAHFRLRVPRRPPARVPGVAEAAPPEAAGGSNREETESER